MTRDDIFFILHERNYITDVARNPVPVPPSLDATQPGTTPAIVSAVDAQAASASSMPMSMTLTTTTTARTNDAVGGGAEGSSASIISGQESADSQASLAGAAAISSTEDGEPQRSPSLVGSPAANALGLHAGAPSSGTDPNGPSTSVSAASLPPPSGPATPSTPGPATTMTTAFIPGVHPAPQSVPPPPHHQSQSQPGGIFRGNQWTKLREQKLVQAAIAAGQPAPEGLIHKWAVGGGGGGGVVTESGGGGMSEVSTPPPQLPPPPSRPASAPPRAAGHYRGNGWTARKKERDPHGSSGTPTNAQQRGSSTGGGGAAAGRPRSPVRKLVIPTSYKIHPDRAEVQAYLDKHFETKKDWIRLRPDRLKWTPFLVTRVFGLGVDVGSTAVDGMAHQGGGDGDTAAAGTSKGLGRGQGGLGAKGGESLSTSVFGGAAADDAAGTDFALDNYAAGGGGYHDSGAVDDADDVDAEGEVDDEEVVGARRPTRGRKVARQMDSEEEEEVVEEEPLFPPSSSSTDDDDDSDDEDGYFPRKRPRYGGAGARHNDRGGGGSRRRAAAATTTNGTSNSPQQPQRRTSSRRLSTRQQGSAISAADRVGDEEDPSYGDGVGPSRRLPGRQASRAASRILATQAGMLRDSSSSEEEDERRQPRRTGRSGTSPVKIPPATDEQQPEQAQTLESVAVGDRANVGDQQQATSMVVDPSPELVAP